MNKHYRLPIILGFTFILIVGVSMFVGYYFFTLENTSSNIDLSVSQAEDHDLNELFKRSLDKYSSLDLEEIYQAFESDANQQLQGFSIDLDLQGLNLPD